MKSNKRTRVDSQIFEKAANLWPYLENMTMLKMLMEFLGPHKTFELCKIKERNLSPKLFLQISQNDLQQSKFVLRFHANPRNS